MLFPAVILLGGIEFRTVLGKKKIWNEKKEDKLEKAKRKQE